MDMDEINSDVSYVSRVSDQFGFLGDRQRRNTAPNLDIGNELVTLRVRNHLMNQFAAREISHRLSAFEQKIGELSLDSPSASAPLRHGKPLHLIPVNWKNDQVS
jgi:hypothetical protein